MRSSCGIRYDRADDALDDRLAPQQSFWHRRDGRTRMLDGKIVVRKAPLAVLQGTLVVLLLYVDDDVVMMTIVAVVFVRRPGPLVVMVRVARQRAVVMRLRPMTVCAERPMKRHVDGGQDLDSAEPNEACEQGCPTNGRSGPS
jgi:hypothetical protein